jgi:hypothetical protein
VFIVPTKQAIIIAEVNYIGPVHEWMLGVVPSISDSVIPPDKVDEYRADAKVRPTHRCWRLQRHRTPARRLPSECRLLSVCRLWARDLPEYDYEYGLGVRDMNEGGEKTRCRWGR